MSFGLSISKGSRFGIYKECLVDTKFVIHALTINLKVVKISLETRRQKPARLEDKILKICSTWAFESRTTDLTRGGNLLSSSILKEIYSERTRE
jgi:hypothetical protein